MTNVWNQPWQQQDDWGENVRPLGAERRMAEKAKDDEIKDEDGFTEVENKKKRFMKTSIFDGAIHEAKKYSPMTVGHPVGKCCCHPNTFKALTETDDKHSFEKVETPKNAKVETPRNEKVETPKKAKVESLKNKSRNSEKGKR